MKRVLPILLVIILLVITNSFQAQPWNTLLPKNKVENGSLTFFDIQKAFNDYWTPKNVVDGYYILNGEKTKAGGWKQFKRWEWYWENRVNPVTGAFPNTSAWEELQKINKSMEGQRSPSGQWTSMGPSTSPGGYAGLGRLNCIGFHPTNSNTYYVGAASGGIWKTTDGGTNWVPQGDEMEAIGISDIIVLSTTGDDIVYAATGDKDHSDTYSVGVLKSIDGGTTWQTTGLTFTAGQKELINRLLVDPTNNDIFYAATTLGVYHTTDAGVTWNVLTSTEFIDLEFKPGVSSTLYGSTWYGDIYTSTDSGITWTLTLSTSGRRTELAVSPNNADVVYALIANTSSGLYGVYKSTDSGASFTSVYNGINLLGWNCNGGDSGGQAWYDLCIAADPNNVNTVFLGGVNTWKSADGGITWNINNHWSSTCGGNASIVHADKHNFTYQNGSSTLFECNDGGLYSTSNGGATWSHLSDGMIISQMYRLGVAQTTSADVITGLQDNGTKALLTSVWNDVIGGDGMECLIDYSDENTQYGSLYYGSIYRTTNHWNNSTNISSGISGNAAWITPYVQDPNNSNTLFVGYQDVWTSANQGNSWTQLSTWGSSTLRSLAVAPSNSNYIYTATTSTLYGTSDGGSTWTNITGSLPTWASNITYISVKYDDPTTIWVAMGEFNSYGVFESTDGGSTWTDISAGLPLLPTNCVIQNRQNTSQVDLYAATDVGVYLKLGDASWIPFYNNMPNVVVTELDIYYDDINPNNSMIRAATYGRGLWESDLYSTIVTLEADFYADNNSVEIGETVLFTDTSTGSPTSWEWTFEGGTPGSYTGQIPTPILYDIAGTWDVTLIVSNMLDADTNTKVNYITVTYPAPTADFEANLTTGDIPLQVTFTDLSVDSVNTWSWDFGDGGTSILQLPVYTYVVAGIYTVSLTVTGPGGSDTVVKTDYIVAIEPVPTADFNGNPTSGDAPLIVSFTDLSVDSVDTWLWDFGDGGTSTFQLPVYTYVNSGIYSVSLTVTGPGGSDSIVKLNYITAIEPAPIADFVGEPTTGEAPLLVNFTDLSSGAVDAWDWNFGDGDSSSVQYPAHEYLTPGNFTVSLTVTGPGGISTNEKTDYILIAVGIGENSSEALVVYPNPVTNSLHIIFPSVKNRVLKIISSKGNNVLTHISKGKEEIINMHHLANGVYSLIINESEMIHTIKVVKK
ncbi:MAG: PKD domain-containing protein [Bacteroidetes bacterium]|nr:PKD domain-containing protein [Bacteroidota bacterium]MBL6944046.1 PKD domain-containing protein [Bacteroidales bacterium]